MKKIIRICDECGEELHFGYKCEVCGLEVCSRCTNETWGECDCGYLCPTHYKQVKEFIEGLKGWTVEASNERLWEQLCDLRARVVKLEPSEEPKGAEWIVSKAEGEYRVNHSGTDYAGWASDMGSCRFIQLVPDAADALYKHIRRERGQ